MRIGFIEDTPLHGGTQIWVSEATRYFLGKGEAVTVLCPADMWMQKQIDGTGAQVCTYDWHGVMEEGHDSRKTWAPVPWAIATWCCVPFIHHVVAFIVQYSLRVV